MPAPAVNRVYLIGNLTRDPVLEHLPTGQPVAHFGMAMNTRVRDQASGEFLPVTCFVDVSVFGRQAEVANRYVRRGEPLFVEGRLQHERTDSTDGSIRSRLSVVAQRIQLLPRRPPSAEAEDSASPGGSERQRRIEKLEKVDKV